MATHRPLVVIDGIIHRLPIGDLLLTPSEVDCVFVESVELDTLPAGIPVYVSGDNEIAKAQADDANTADPIGLVKADILPLATGIVQVSGVIELTTVQWDNITGDIGGLNNNVIYYLVDGPPGGLTTIMPTTSSNFVTIVGRSISSTKMKLVIERAVQIP
jgi:hypothetical protein